MSDKYRLTEECIMYDGDRLHRIQALRDIYPFRAPKVAEGSLGGYIDCTGNLSQQGECWVDDDAIVTVSAVVEDDAVVCCSAKVCGRARIKDRAWVGDHAIVNGRSIIKNEAVVAHSASVFGTAVVKDTAVVKHESKVYGQAVISGHVSIIGQSTINAGSISKQPIHIMSGDWPITMYDGLITIGCHTASVDQWDQYSESDLQDIEAESWKKWIKYKDNILGICRSYFSE